MDTGFLNLLENLLIFKSANSLYDVDNTVTMRVKPALCMHNSALVGNTPSLVWCAVWFGR
jgi:hypothetical protein